MALLDMTNTVDFSTFILLQSAKLICEAELYTEIDEESFLYDEMYEMDTVAIIHMILRDRIKTIEIKSLMADATLQIFQSEEDLTNVQDFVDAISEGRYKGFIRSRTNQFSNYCYKN